MGRPSVSIIDNAQSETPSCAVSEESSKPAGRPVRRTRLRNIPQPSHANDNRKRKAAEDDAGSAVQKGVADAATKKPSCKRRRVSESTSVARAPTKRARKVAPKSDRLQSKSKSVMRAEGDGPAVLRIRIDPTSHTARLSMLAAVAAVHNSLTGRIELDLSPSSSVQ
ncbi:hypothetical protein OH76DRAFT_931313 [Lentinus brumalis]|uniref:Uncharacterized protein n=1 Tax=Lentinus brumalis TaxID=2498619 RepID=A0A371CZP7_9APHY|nr:hypothetical protein OH76DRAFT_931313 [Polyporus brumalis]